MTEQTQPQTDVTSKPQGQRDLRQEITDRMVQSLERGEIPWQRPWETLEHGLPRNMATGNVYKGGNRFILQMTQLDQGYADPRFGTIKQINEMGGRVNKGEHGHPIELWKDQPFWQRTDVRIVLDGQPVRVFGENRDGIDVGAINDKKASIRTKPEHLAVLHKGRAMSSWASAHEILDRTVSKVYVVFNAEQCSGLNLEPLQVPDNRVLSVERGEKLMQTMQKDGVAFKQHAEAFYSPARDEIYLPPREAFKSQEGYYGTALHEIGRATGAQHRLNRDGITGGHRFGSEGYAKEELRAELFSTFMAAETGIPHDEEQHKAYIQSWAKALKEDKNEIFRAASEAGKAVDYVLGKEREWQAEKSQTAGQDIDNAIGDAEKTQNEVMNARPSEPSMIWAKVNNAAEMAERGRDGADGLSKVCIDQQIIFTTAEYDRLTENLLADNPLIAGMGGTEDDGTTHVVEVMASGRQRLHIDPEGYKYPRYVGIPESDVEAFLARRSFHLDVEQQHAPVNVSAENQALAERVEDEPKLAPDRVDVDKAPGKATQRTSRRSTGDAEVSR